MVMKVKVKVKVKMKVKVKVKVNVDGDGDGDERTSVMERNVLAGRRGTMFVKWDVVTQSPKQLIHLI